ncbi:hypothetical protein JAAARDRAFT_311508 [Jaapia argillacea MUCL 33604]|uniref:Cyclase n=1 Tax=Jaapia argillacea MUCL 33604 TaxID=933084 RepID=A0A067PRH9_9AGAM|nr:hypothetical protein JAAARDRAFT_311508 [Jaapia argillacea MUCL 33604]
MSPSSRTFIDLSHELRNDRVQIYPGDPPFTSVPFATIPIHGFNVHAISMGSHTGTHADSPFHWFEGGRTIEQMPLDMFIGRCLVVDLAKKGERDERERIHWEEVEEYGDQMGEGVIVLLYTGWSKHWGSPKYYDHPYFDRRVAEEIIARGVKVIGVDTLSPDETRLSDSTGGEGGHVDDFGIHEVVLGADGVIVENLTNIGEILVSGWESRKLMVSMVPLKLGGSDGSPVRAYAWHEG